MATQEQSDFIQTHEGELTPSQAAHLLEMDQGDTSGTNLLETGSEPGASTGDDGATLTPGEAGKTDATDTKAGEAAVATATGDEIDPAKTVILAKDGKHTIRYEKLVEAREGEKHWRGVAESTQQQLAQLQADAAARAAAGQTATKADNQVAAATAAIDAGADPGLFGDFSEDALAKGIEKLVEQRVAERLAPIEAKLVPVQQKHVQDTNQAHYNAIYEKHPDADSIFESKELADWINAQPTFVRDGYRDVFKNGSTDQVIELFDSFKQATGESQANADAGTTAKKDVDVKEAAKAAIAGATPAVPSSLSDFPGGRAGAGTREEAMAGMDNGQQLLSAMDNMTPQQIEDFLNRRI